MNPQELFRIVTELIRAACARGDLEWSLLAEWERQWNNCQQKLPNLERAVADLQEKLKLSLEPPLQYAVFLGPAPGAEREVIVGTGTTRLEVHLTDEVNVGPHDIALGQQVVLNSEHNVVAVRGPYTGGETAEVVNILKPDHAAEVLEVLQGMPEAPLTLRVRWREGEEIEVDCGQGLAGYTIRRGDIVGLDSDAEAATSKVRPRLHVRCGGQEGIVVEISDELFEQGVQIGDIVRVDGTLKLAFEKLPSYETGGLTLEDIPDVSYEDIGGLEGQIEQVYDAIELPYLYRAQFEAYQLSRPKGLLLYGPPGCGKTMIAKAVANSLTRAIREHLHGLERHIVLYKRVLDGGQDDVLLLGEVRALVTNPEDAEGITTLDDAVHYLSDALQYHRVNLDTLDKELHTIRTVLSTREGVRGFFLNVKGPELLDKYVGETEHRIRKIFEEARRYATFYTPVVIFFDEMESMFRARGSGRSSDVETTIVPQFLAELDGVEASENLIIIGASNRAELIDMAIMRPGRLDIKIKVDRPTREAALDIFALYLQPTLPLSADGVPEAKNTVEGLGKVVFRTAYRCSDDRGVALDKLGELEPLARALPDGCDFRLACALPADDIAALATWPPRSTIREVLAALDEASILAQVLRRFKGTADVGHVAECLGALHTQLEGNATAQALVDTQIRQEWLAEALVFEMIAILYSPSSLMHVLTTTGNRYTFYIKDFMSGAVIANIVTRAKKSAVKRVVLGQEDMTQGICLDDLRTAIRNEFEEGKDQLAQNKLSAELGLNEQLKFVELVLQTGQIDPWNEEKLRPYVAYADV